MASYSTATLEATNNRKRVAFFSGIRSYTYCKNYVLLIVLRNTNGPPFTNVIADHLLHKSQSLLHVLY